MKKCTNCRLSKPLSDFYRQKKGLSERQWWCKSCSNEYHKKYSKENRASLNRNARKWLEANKEKYLELQRIGQRIYTGKYPKKIKAHSAIHSALDSGKLAKLACEVCGNFISEAHHHDYNKPLDVWWLCKEHHILADKGKLRLYV